MRARALLAALGLALGLGLGVAAPAVAAAPAAVGADTLKPTRDDLKIPDQTGNGDTPLLSGFIDSLCPAIAPPTPVVPFSNIDAQPGDGLYANYSWSGLFWTTYDQSCFSPNRLDTGTGSGINDVASQFDAMVNDAQSYALDPDTTIAFDPVMASAAANARDTLFTPWLLPAFAAVGLVVALMAFTQSGTAAANVGIAALVTLAVVMGVASDPGRIPRAVDGVTVDVTQSVSKQMVQWTGGSQYGVDAEHATTESYYRATSYQAWLQGMFCGDTVAERDFGPRFLDAQAFTVGEWKRVQADPAAQRALTVKKQQAWLDAAQELQRDRPSAFACWSGAQNGRIAASTKHLAATICAGAVVFVTSGAVVVMRWVLRMGILLAIAMGALLLASRRITSGFVEVLVVGLVGPPVLAAVAGLTLFAFSAVMRDPDQTWWQSILSVLFMGIALWWLRKPLGRVLAGVGESGAVAGYAAGRMRRFSRGYGRTRSGGGGDSGGDAAAVAGLVGGVVGGKVGAAAGNVAASGGDGRRSEGAADLGQPASAGGSVWYGKDLDGPRRATITAGGAPQGREVDVYDKPVDLGPGESITFNPATGKGIVHAVQNAQAGPTEGGGTVGPGEFVEGQHERAAAGVSSRLAGYQAAAEARGEAPTGVQVPSGDGRRASAAQGRGDGKFHAAPVDGGDGRR